MLGDDRTQAGIVMPMQFGHALSVALKERTVAGQLSPKIKIGLAHLQEFSSERVVEHGKPLCGNCERRGP
jgi:hypothetical protein